MCPIIVNNS